MLYFRGDIQDDPGIHDAGVSHSEDNAPEEKEDDTLYCGQCGYEITKNRFVYSFDGQKNFAFANPYGNAFRITCFSHAPGTVIIGGYTEEATWFAGYAWSYCICAGCRSHLGWHYIHGGAGSPETGFFGLISDMLK